MTRIIKLKNGLMFEGHCRNRDTIAEDGYVSLDVSSVNIPLELIEKHLLVCGDEVKDVKIHRRAEPDSIKEA